MEESAADLILGGGGEIWIRGYCSFSPRSHMKLPTNGTPIYGGYLSVALRNKAGQTLWSYLAMLKTGSGKIPKDLSNRIVKHIGEGLNQAEASTAAEASPGPSVALSGAGATFPYPVYQKWFTNFRMDHPETQIRYDSIGSEAGIRKLLAGGVDFGASDNRVAIREIAPGEESKYLFFPSVVGAVVPIVNLPGLPADIAFTPEALAGIFLGKITKRNDPILRAANRGINLPGLDIVVVHRADGSGTSYAWTSFLSKTSPEWNSEVGSSLAPNWPIGRAATGNDGVAKLVKEVGGSIGYVEYIYALQNHLGYEKVRNQNGEFVEASLESIAAAANHGADVPNDLKLSLVNAPGAGAISYCVAHMGRDAGPRCRRREVARRSRRCCSGCSGPDNGRLPRSGTSDFRERSWAKKRTRSIGFTENGVCISLGCESSPRPALYSERHDKPHQYRCQFPIRIHSGIGLASRPRR
jgi:phosphate transport system substrate-binding protein